LPLCGAWASFVALARLALLALLSLSPRLGCCNAFYSRGLPGISSFLPGEDRPTCGIALDMWLFARRVEVSVGLIFPTLSKLWNLSRNVSKSCAGSNVHSP